MMKIVESLFAVEVRTNYEKKYVSILDVRNDESDVYVSQLQLKWFIFEPKETEFKQSQWTICTLD
mgnify:CR=1 FL=1